MKKMLDLPEPTVMALRIEAAEQNVKSVKEHMQNILISHAAGKTKVVSSAVDMPPQKSPVVVEKVEKKVEEPSVDVGNKGDSF